MPRVGGAVWVVRCVFRMWLVLLGGASIMSHLGKIIATPTFSILGIFGIGNFFGRHLIEETRSKKLEQNY